MKARIRRPPASEMLLRPLVDPNRCSQNPSEIVALDSTGHGGPKAAPEAHHFSKVSGPNVSWIEDIIHPAPGMVGTRLAGNALTVTDFHA